jgi:hypothetical protein
MSLCTYCRIHNEESLIDIGEENYSQIMAIWSEDELEAEEMWIPKDLQGYQICESCYEKKKNNFNKLTGDIKCK